MGNFESRLAKLEVKAGLTGSPYQFMTEAELEAKIAEILLPCGIDYLALTEDEKGDLLLQMRRDFRELGYK
jgi:hypothetical protein